MKENNTPNSHCSICPFAETCLRRNKQSRRCWKPSTTIELSTVSLSRTRLGILTIVTWLLKLTTVSTPGSWVSQFWPADSPMAEILPSSKSRISSKPSSQRAGCSHFSRAARTSRSWTSLSSWTEPRMPAVRKSNESKAMTSPSLSSGKPQTLTSFAKWSWNTVKTLRSSNWM